MRYIIGIQAVLILVLVGVVGYRDAVLSRRISVLHESLLATENSVLKTQQIQEDQLKRELNNLKRSR